ncbi:predicted ORF [Xanthomonas phage XacN1]|nr:predicted ORF [Xanthomonas phage XacN1]
MDYVLLGAIVIFALIVVGYGTYKHYKKKARLLQKKLDKATGETPAEETPSAPVAGGSGGGSKTTGVKQQIK